MRTSKSIGKIFGMALAFVLIGAMLPLGAFVSHSQVEASPATTSNGYVVTTGAEPLSTTSASQRKLVVTSDGNLHVAYHRKDGSGILQIYHAESSDEGVTWTEEQVTFASRDQNFPALAVDSIDNLHLVWEDGRDGQPGIVPNTYYEKKTTSWQPAELVALYATIPSIAIDSNDNVHVAYGVYVYGAGYYGGGNGIRWRMRTSAGWQTEESISSDKYWSRNPAIAIDGNNDVHIAWNHAPEYKYYDTHYRKRTASGWEPEVEIAGDSEFLSTYPSMVIDDDNHVHIAWAHLEGRSSPYSDDGYFSIRYRKYTDAWQPIEILESPTAYEQCRPVISIDGNNHIHVVWSGQHAGSPTYYQLRYREYTTTWQPIEDLTSSTSDNQMYPSSMWAFYPVVGGIKTNQPEKGCSLVWMDGTTVRYLSPQPVQPSPVQITNEPGDELYPDQSEDGQYIVMASNRDGGYGDIWRIDSDGMSFVKLTSMPKSPIYGIERHAWNPVFHPQGEFVYYMDNSLSGPDYHWFVRTGTDGTGVREPILYIPADDGGGKLCFSPDGSKFAFIYSSYDEFGTRWARRDLIIASSDGSDLETSYSRDRMRNELGIYRDDNMRRPGIAWSPDGTRIYFKREDASGVMSLYLINADGTELVRLTAASVGYCAWPALSPDGTKIAFQCRENDEADYELFIMSADGSNIVQVTDNDFEDQFPTWSYDGSSIIYSSNADGDYDLWSVSTEPSRIGVTRWEVTNLYETNLLREFVGRVFDLVGDSVWCYVDVYVTEDELIKDVRIKLHDGQLVNLQKQASGHYRAELRLRGALDPEHVLVKMLEVLCIVQGTGVVTVPIGRQEILDFHMVRMVITDTDEQVHYITESEEGQSLPERLPTFEDVMWDMLPGPWITEEGTFYSGFSPVGLLVTDSDGRRVGALYEGGVFVGEVNEIPGALYWGRELDFQFVFIPDSSGGNTITVAGIESGHYVLIVLSSKEGKADTFAALDISTASGTVHKYTIYWDALSQGKTGVTIEKDHDGDGEMDEVIITGTPETPTDPSPIDDAAEVSLNTILNWRGDDSDSVTYNVYFGTNMNLPLVSERQTEMTYVPTLNSGTRYYWTVTAINEHSIYSTGPVWSFSTEGFCQDEPTPEVGFADLIAEDKLVIAYNFDPFTTVPTAVAGWTWYDPTLPPAQNNLAKLHKNTAYWIKVTEDCWLTYGTHTYHLAAGWNNPVWLGC